MKTIRPSIAAAELLLIFPATIFMGALVIRSLQPLQYEPAHTAQRIVDWYAARVHLGLWMLLIALPLTVLATGSVTLLRAWNDNAELRQQARQTLAESSSPSSRCTCCRTDLRLALSMRETDYAPHARNRLFR